MSSHNRAFSASRNRAFGASRNRARGGATVRDYPDLLIWLPFNTEDDWLLDYSGNERDVVETGDLTIWTEGGKFGGAAGFFGLPSTDHYLQRPINDSVLDFGAGDFTICVWAFFDEENFEYEQCVLEKFAGRTGPGWTIYKAGLEPVDEIDESGEPNDVQVYLSGPNIVLEGVASINGANAWNHIVVRRRASDDRWELLVNNASADLQTNSADLGSTSEPLKLGHRNETDGRNFQIDGRMDDVAIWARYLEDAEIATIYNEGVYAFLNEE